MSITHIKKLAYDSTKQNLIIAFKGGTTYNYYPVDITTFKSLLYADHLTRAIHKLVRNGKLVGVRQ